jgi:endonuclease YncB( thermonuclease family)
VSEHDLIWPPPEPVAGVAAASVPHLYEYRFVPTRVVDGDTVVGIIKVGFNIDLTDRVRLFGLNCPETSGPHASLEGETAKAFTARWIMREGVSFWLHCRRFNDRDKWDRVLATIYAEGDPVSLNDALLKGGYAVPMPD